MKQSSTTLPTPQPNKRRPSSAKRRKANRTARKDVKKFAALQQNLMEMIAEWYDNNLAQERQKTRLARERHQIQASKRSERTDKTES